MLWALNVSDGLNPRAFTPYMQWGERASLILQASSLESLFLCLCFNCLISCYL